MVGATRILVGEIVSVTSFSEVSKWGLIIYILFTLHKTVTPNNVRMVIQPILHHHHNH